MRTPKEIHNCAKCGGELEVAEDRLGWHKMHSCYSNGVYLCDADHDEFHRLWRLNRTRYGINGSVQKIQLIKFKRKHGIAQYKSVRDCTAAIQDLYQQHHKKMMRLMFIMDQRCWRMWMNEIPPESWWNRIGRMIIKPVVELAG